MSFPITVDAALSSAEQPAKYGPFLSGAARYEILLRLDTVGLTAVFAAQKSTDGGLTWAEVDAAHAPVPTGFPFVPYACCQAGAILYAAYVDQSIGLALVTFDTGADLWGTPASIPGPPTGGFANSGEGGYTLYQCCLEHSPFDNSLVMLMPGDLVTIDDVNHAISVFNRYDIGGALWGSWADLGFLDYSNITTWDQVPCGLVIDSASGKAVALMQQVARAGPGNLVSTQITAPGAFSIVLPADVPATGNAQLWGAGGGGSPGTDIGSGGGGGAFKAGTVNLTPSGTLTGTVGAGGASGADGNATTCQTLTGNPGHAGTAGLLAPGGAGGAGDHNGGAGATTNGGGTTGGGGGGSALATADGSDGIAGGATNGGAGGAGQGAGGAGGNDNPFNPPTGGQPGANPGGGGGGHGGADLTTPGGNNGGDGEFDVTWISVRNTNDCRVFQQLINPDNSLGTLSEIVAGRYPARDKNAQPIPISFDSATFGGLVFIVFTGATSTGGTANITVGAGILADPVSFVAITFSSGNGGNGRDPSPAIAAATGALYCSYISAPTGQPVSFLARLKSGSGFGAPATIGTLSTGDVHAFSRLQAQIFAGALELTWGTPASAFFDAISPV